MADLCLRTRYRTVHWCHEWDHNVVDEVLLHGAVGEIHALGETGVIHLLFTCGDANSVEIFVEEEVECDLHETDGTENVADGEDPRDPVDIGRVLGDPNVQGGCQNENSHLHGQEVGFEQSMEEVEDALVVRVL